MKHHDLKDYICIGLTAFCVLAAGIAFFFCLYEMDAIRSGIDNLFRILSPIIYGVVFAYLMSPLYNHFTKKLSLFLFKKIKKEKKALAYAKGLSTLITISLALLLIFGLIAMVLPQVIQSITGIIESMPRNLQNLSVWIENLLADNPDMEDVIMSYYNDGVKWLENWIRQSLLPNVQVLVTGISLSVMSMINLLKNLLIGLIVAIYVINSKETFIAQAKKIIYSILPESNAAFITDQFRLAHKMFGGFIIGKIIDSLIIGAICFVGMSILNMPYVMLVSVIIGVTNIIPFFGPFIGAVPSALLILLANPLKSLYFLIFVLVLQQFDGNILGPKILGDSTGLSSFWVLFSILLFGGLWGFVGMVIGVPLFAVIYHLVRLTVNHFLRKKELSTVTEEYLDK